MLITVTVTHTVVIIGQSCIRVAVRAASTFRAVNGCIWVAVRATNTVRAVNGVAVSDMVTRTAVWYFRSTLLTLPTLTTQEGSPKPVGEYPSWRQQAF